MAGSNSIGRVRQPVARGRGGW